MIDLFVIFIYFIASLFLFSYGMNCYVIVWLFLRSYRKGQKTNASIEERSGYIWEDLETVPTITTQIPLYNELNVAERVIRAAAAMDYPAGKHEVQVLDDSTDETQLIVDQVAEELRKAGKDISVVRRSDRVGYKAGALEEGTKWAKGEFLAVFDSDFVPQKDFLKRLVPFFLKRQQGWPRSSKMGAYKQRLLTIYSDTVFGNRRSLYYRTKCTRFFWTLYEFQRHCWHLEKANYCGCGWLEARYFDRRSGSFLPGPASRLESYFCPGCGCSCRNSSNRFSL